MLLTPFSGRRLLKLLLALPALLAGTHAAQA
jgi:hypothetical protein